MSYATKSNVSNISGIDSDNVSDIWLTMADQHVEDLLGYDMDSGLDNRIQYWDILNRNDFYTNYDGHREFVLDRWPIVEMVYLKNDPYNTPTELTLNEDYWINYIANIIVVNSNIDIEQGQRKLKAKYSWGYESIPSDVSNYADMYAAMLQEMNRNVARNNSDKILREIEMGRWREKYDIDNKAVKSKYANILSSLGNKIITKYSISQ